MNFDKGYQTGSFFQMKGQNGLSFSLKAEALTSNNLEIGQGCRRLVGKSAPFQSAGKFNTSIAMH